MGFGGVEESEEYETLSERLPPDTKYLVDEFDITISCARFPCITLGNSSVVELYDGVVCEDSGASLSAVRFSENVISTEQEVSKEVYISQTSANFFVPNESKLCSCPSESSFPDLKVGKPPEEKSIVKKTKVLSNSEYILDKPIRYLPGLSARCWRQLENGGFYTVYLQPVQKMLVIFL